jgi:hypothetical protein
MWNNARFIAVMAPVRHVTNYVRNIFIMHNSYCRGGEADEISRESDEKIVSDHS